MQKVPHSQLLVTAALSSESWAPCLSPVRHVVDPSSTTIRVEGLHDRRHWRAKLQASGHARPPFPIRTCDFTGAWSRRHGYIIHWAFSLNGALGEERKWRLLPCDASATELIRALRWRNRPKKSGAKSSGLSWFITSKITAQMRFICKSLAESSVAKINSFRCAAGAIIGDQEAGGETGFGWDQRPHRANLLLLFLFCVFASSQQITAPCWSGEEISQARLWMQELRFGYPHIHLF